MKLAAIAFIAVIALVGSALAHLSIRNELEIVRGVRVALDARRALEQRSRPPGVEGELTIVEGDPPIYVVHTASVTRAGSPLPANDPRAERHREALQKKSIKTELGEAWRATVSDGKTSAELLSRPAPIPIAFPWLAALIAFVAGASIAYLHRAAGVLIAAAAMLAGAYLSVDSASEAAVAYLSTGTGVVLQPIKVLIAPAVFAAVVAAIAVFATRKKD